LRGRFCAWPETIHVTPAICHYRHERRGHLTYLLKLFVTGTSPRTQRAISNLNRICEEELLGEYKLEIIDVLTDPQAAEDERILATPTLIKQLPPPLRRVIGDLSDKDKVLLGLEVRRDSDHTPANPGKK
jgi:circadian clock protein KaiB